MDPIEAFSKFDIELSPVGDKFRGFCPFHSESSPSFFVYPDGSWYCFSCQKGGTYKKFCSMFGKEESHIQKFENIKEKEVINLEKLKTKLSSDLYFEVEDCSFDKKSVAWSRFDEFWLDLRFMDNDSVLMEKVLFIKKSFNEILKFVKSS